MTESIFPRARSCCPSCVDGLGFAAGGVAQGAALGAKAGSIVPGVGNVVGAVIGAVVSVLGSLLKKKKPVRPTGQQVADCQALLKEYETFIALNPPPAGRTLGLQQLKDLHWCIQALNGAHYTGTKDPRWFDGSFVFNEDLARQTVKAVFNTPVGGTVTVVPTPWKDPKGRLIQSAGFSFVNGPFISLRDLNDRYFAPAVIRVCQDTAGKGAPGCPDYYNLPVSKRLLLDLLDYAASVELPQVVLPEEPPPAATIPVPAASVPANITPPAIVAPPAAASPTPESLSAGIRQIVDSLVATPAGQQMTQQQLVDAASATSLQWLRSQQVPTGTPQAQQAVAATVAAQVESKRDWLVPVGLTAAGFGALYLLFGRRRKRA